MKVIVLAFSLLILLVLPAVADCDWAVSEYNSAISDIDSYLRRYSRCVANSRGNDDCSSEFRRLRSAQDDFKNAISRYQSECRR
jgi:hypothetical protein